MYITSGNLNIRHPVKISTYTVKASNKVMGSVNMNPSLNKNIFCDIKIYWIILKDKFSLSVGSWRY